MVYQSRKASDWNRFPRRHQQVGQDPLVAGKIWMVVGLVVGVGVGLAVGWSMTGPGWPWLGNDMVVGEWWVGGIVLVPVGWAVVLVEIGLGETSVACRS